MQKRFTEVAKPVFPYHEGTGIVNGKIAVLLAVAASIRFNFVLALIVPQLLFW
jgi:hypothetical protein